MQEQLFLTAKDMLGYAEEHIVINGTNKLLNYSLSNSLDDIEIAIFARTGHNVNLEKAYWCFNSALSISEKHLMNIRKVNYSMTVVDKNDYRVIMVNMRAGDKWFLTFFGIAENGETLCVEDIVNNFFDDGRKKKSDDDNDSENG